jgi:hypothetical protein
MLHIAGSHMPTPLWTHALSRDYAWSDERMDALPPTKLAVRHYQGWWYEKAPEFSAGSLEEVLSPVASPSLFDVVKRWIHSTPAIDSA